MAGFNVNVSFLGGNKIENVQVRPLICCGQGCVVRVRWGHAGEQLLVAR